MAKCFLILSLICLGLAAAGITILSVEWWCFMAAAFLMLFDIDDDDEEDPPAL